MSQLYQSARIFTEPQIEVTLNDENVVVNVVEASPEIEVTISQAAYWGAIQGTLSNQTDLQNALDAKVPYTGATGNVNLGEYGITSGYVQLDTTPTTYTAAVGNIGWNDTVGTIETTLKGGNVVFKHGRDMFERIVNKTGGALNRTAYQAVRISTAQGQRLGVALAQANNDNNSADTIGLVVEDIAVNQEGYIYTVGEVGEINTTGSLQGETWADGDVLYLSPTTAGRITNVKPVAPQHLVVIGYVVYAHANHGKIYVKVMNGWEIGELHDVRITNPLNNQVLKYNDSLNIWENGTASGGVTSITASSPLTGGTITTSGTIGIQQATGSQDGYLSATDWTTFNSKQNALTNPVTGTGTSGQVSYWSGSTTQAGSNNLFWDAANSRLGVGTNAPARTFDVNGLAGFTGTTASDGGQLGSESLGSGGWTLGAGWTGDFATGFAHSSGTATLTNTLAGVVSNVYQIQYTISGRTTGTISIAFGGRTLSSISATGTQYIYATTTGTVVITPTNDFNGTIIPSIKIISKGNAVIQLRNSSGTLVNEVRTSNSNSNTYIGIDAGSRSITATDSVAIGQFSLQSNVSGQNNIAIGKGALQNAANPSTTIAIGREALLNNLGGAFGVAIGDRAGVNSTGGGQNVYIGTNAGLAATTSGFNVLVGHNSGASLTTNNIVVGVGVNAATNNTGGGWTAIGGDAARYYSGGTTSATSFTNGVYLGATTKVGSAGASNEIVIGYQAEGLGSNTTVIGNSSTTFGRWWGNLLIGTSTNAGQALQVSGISSFTGTTASDGGQLGSELLGSGGWTLGAGWTGDFATGFTHSSGTATLTNTLAAVNGTYYQIAYTVTNRTTGSFTIAFGGYTSGNLTSTGSVGPRATSTGTVVITPTTDFNGTIVLSIRVISASSASIQLRNSSGTVTNEIRNDASNTNIFVGLNAGSRNISIGQRNTFIGLNSGQNNTSGIDNTFYGYLSGQNVSIGAANSLFGSSAGVAISTGSNNSLFGAAAGLSITTGERNCFFGFFSGTSTTTQLSNSFFGTFCGQSNTGSYNSAFGEGTLSTNQSGSYNSAFGQRAGRLTNAGSNLTTTDNSIFIGADSRANAISETNQIVIGYQGRGLGSNTTVIGNSSTTFGRWWGNLLIGTSTNAGFALDVNGTARIQNDLTISDTRNLILDTSTGTKIGTATSQKLGFWNATPIVQPTTAVAAATRVGGAGTTVTDSDTFDGYTLAQIVKALRNTGILA